MKMFTFCLWASALLASVPLSACGNGSSAGAVSITDDFDDEQIDTEKWGSDTQDFGEGEAEFVERDGVLEMIGTPGGNLDHPWIATLFPYDSDWEVQVDVENAVDPDSEENGQYPSIGLGVFHHGDRGDRFRFDMYTDTIRHYRGFYLQTWEDDYDEMTDDSLEIPGLTNAALRIRFDSVTKLLTLSYDVDPTDGYQWIVFTIVSVGDGHPADRSVDWDMVPGTDWFSISVYGNGGDITAGMLRVDDFSTVGGFRP